MACVSAHMIVVLAAIGASLQPDNPEGILRAAIAREMGRASGGTASIVVSPGQGDGLRAYWPGAPEALEKGATLDVAWKGEYLFRIDVRQEDEIVRTITCDGTHVDTGDGALWDIEFLYWESGRDSELTSEFRDLMWPHGLFRMYFFPLARGVLAFPYESYFRPHIALQFGSEEEPGAGASDGLARVVAGSSPKGARDNLLQWESVVDQEHEYAVLEFREMANGEEICVYEFSRPFEVAGGFWIPGEFCFSAPFVAADATFNAHLVQDSVSFTAPTESAAFALPETTYGRLVRSSWALDILVRISEELGGVGFTPRWLQAAFGLLCCVGLAGVAIHLRRRRRQRAAEQ
ncbi:MAG: hypothetical protein JXR94_09100 [Candidatus Hydrogenedentes bacterium]|nr:hypothetical protein [Candidatus Hydrogenedentota bacterium]